MMAWLDDRAWCHPKLVNLSDRAHRVYVNSLSYSSGMGLGGTLTGQQQKLIGATPALRRELVDARVWDERHRDIYIHDWHVHNGKRDARKAVDRERKKTSRSKDSPADSPADVPKDSQQDGSALKEVTVVKESFTGGSSTSEVDPPLSKDVTDAVAVAKLLQVVGDVDDDGLAKIRGFAARLPEGSLYKVAESVQIQRPTNRVGYAIAALGSELRERAS